MHMCFCYNGNDRCPSCGAMYCANTKGEWVDQRCAEQKVFCMNCKYEGTLGEFAFEYTKHDNQQRRARGPQDFNRR